MERKIQGVNVAVIGGLGFLGSHLVDHLIEDRNCNVLVLDNLITGLKKYKHPKAQFIWCDITHSEDELYRIFINEKIEYVFNYAAEPYIPVSFERPKHVVDINFNGAFNVIQAAQRANVKGILQVSSAEIYGDAPPHKIDETYPANPHSTYGVTKRAIDDMVQVRWKEAKTPAIAMRQFNCVGERETHEYIIPVIIDQLAKHEGQREAIIQLGNDSYRDFQYAGDAVRMAAELLEKGEFGEVYNMGSETGIKMYELARRIGKIMGFNKVMVSPDPLRMRPWEIWHLQSDNKKLYSVIETRPEVDLDEALRRTVKFYQDNGNKWDYVG